MNNSKKLHCFKWRCGLAPTPLTSVELLWQRDARTRIRLLLRSVPDQPAWCAAEVSTVAAEVAAIVHEANQRQIQLSYGDLTVSVGAWVMWIGVQGRRQIVYHIRSRGGESYSWPRPFAVISFIAASKERDAWRRERDAIRRKREAAPAEQAALQWADTYEEWLDGERCRWGY